MEKRRVVITGLGAVTPLGNSREAFWDGLVAGRSGVGPTTAFDAHKLTTRIAAEVKDFDAGALIGKREARRMDRYAQMALVAATEAIADAKFPEDPDVRARTGAIVATGIGGIITVENTTFEVGPGEKWDRISPFFVPDADGERGVGAHLDAVRAARPGVRGRVGVRERERRARPPRTTRSSSAKRSPSSPAAARRRSSPPRWAASAR